MRQLLRLVFVFFVFAPLAMAQGKVDSQWNCPKATVAHNLDVGDRPSHSYTISQGTCTAAKSEIEGVKEKEGASTQFSEASGSSNNWHGVFIVTMENGDKLHYSYSGKGTAKDGQLQSGTNTWSIVAGTGKFKGAKGKGTCTGKGNADGSAVWDCTGTYTLAK
jgi:hypothetical protein